MAVEGSGWINHEPIARERSRADEVRTLFQCLTSETLHHLKAPGRRPEDDDEDSLDVLVMAMLGYAESRQSKVVYRRHHMFKAAAALPSSFSRDSGGLMSLRNIELLVELVLALKALVQLVPRQ